mmetsp:Transcript_21148/g.27308  ORF Transcript_21148/g.27308 Transcript_21148/m.27308 type:complete len:168 (+) Transcript_21148:156-659(+)|eukprot:CAMPEP_0198139454 /NCGR_PEP_ID=MMETSP1443-20131203/2733_1 /TAXON_ID=186043 /ORGANISM="Entomoneis sp., Strain CCMP2396" /LENGTH=167 /DNA_ID=CAMNT_0043801573 /DNA_START=159 /DNA_END=662 /DNA_ORIENTATION=+
MTLPPQVEQVITKVDAFMAKYPHVTQYEKLKGVEEKTGYPKAVFFLVGVTVLSVLLTVIGGMKLIVDLLGFVYPAYMSFKSMDNSQGTKDVSQWLTYWVVFSFFSIIENLLGLLVNMIPFYTWIKIGVIIWMYHPSTMGAKTVYDQGLRPILIPYLESSPSEAKKAE